MRATRRFRGRYPLALLFSTMSSGSCASVVRAVYDEVAFHRIMMASINKCHRIPTREFTGLFARTNTSSIRMIRSIRGTFNETLRMGKSSKVLFYINSLCLINRVGSIVEEGGG